MDVVEAEAESVFGISPDTVNLTILTRWLSTTRRSQNQFVCKQCLLQAPENYQPYDRS